jgi:hypothetical protein
MTGLAFLLDARDETERLVRLRELRVVLALYCGWNSPAKLAADRALCSCAYDAVLEEIDRLPNRLRRRVLASFGASTDAHWLSANRTVVSVHPAPSCTHVHA